MSLPCYHTVYYKGHPIHYLNGTYKIGNMLFPGFLNMNDAKQKVDEYEAQQLQKLFDNQNPPNEKTKVGH